MMQNGNQSVNGAGVDSDWHVGIATKSLARDLGIGKRTRDIMRAVYVLAVFTLIALVLLAS